MTAMLLGRYLEDFSHIYIIYYVLVYIVSYRQIGSAPSALARVTWRPLESAFAKETKRKQKKGNEIRHLLRRVSVAGRVCCGCHLLQRVFDAGVICCGSCLLRVSSAAAGACGWYPRRVCGPSRRVETNNLEKRLNNVVAPPPPFKWFGGLVLPWADQLSVRSGSGSQYIIQPNIIIQLKEYRCLHITVGDGSFMFT
jgi:hypothetical protein